MAKVKGPLFSLTAFGTVGNLLTFRRTPGKVAVYLKPVPTDPVSGAQLWQRGNFASAVSAWGALSGASRAWWNMYAAGGKVSGYICFVRDYLRGGEPYVPPSQCNDGYPCLRNTTPGCPAAIPEYE